MDKTDLVVELIKELKEDVLEVKKSQKTSEQHLAKTMVEMELNRKDWEVHMARTDAVENLVMAVRDESDAKIKKIEKKLTAGYLFKLIVTVAGGLGTIAGSIYGFIRLF